MRAAILACVVLLLALVSGETTAQQPQFVQTDCLTCQPVVDHLNAIIAAESATADQQASAQVRLDGLIADLASVKATLTKAYEQLNEQLAIKDRANKEGRSSDAAAAAEAIDAIRQSTVLPDSERANLEFAIGDAKSEIERLAERMERLKASEDVARDALLDCEESCNAPVTPATGPDPGTGAAPPERPAPIETDCPECGDVADELSRTIETIYNADRMIAQLERRLARSKARYQQNADGYDAAARERLDALEARDALPASDRAGRAAQQRRADGALQRMAIHDVALEKLGFEVRDLEDSLKQATAERADEWEHEESLRQELAECEAACVMRPPITDGPAPPPGPGQTEPIDRDLVTTECAACLQTANNVNRAVGDFRRAGKELGRLEEELQGAELDLGLKRDILATRRAHFLDELARADQVEASGDKAGAQAIRAEARRQELRTVAIEDSIEKLREKVEGLKARVEPKRAEVARLLAEIDALRTALDECEARCLAPPVIVDGPVPPPKDGSPPDDGLVHTPCAACNAAADRLNDAITAANRAREAFDKATRDLATVEEEIADKRAEIERIEDEYTERLVRAGQLRDQGDVAGAEGLRALARADFARTITLASEVEALQWEVERRKSDVTATQAALDMARAAREEARQALEDCERRCAEKPAITDGPQPGDGGTPPKEEPPKPLSPCPECERTAQLLRDAAAATKQADYALVGLKEDLDEVNGEIAAAREEIRRLGGVLDDALTEAARIRAETGDAARAEAVRQHGRSEFRKTIGLEDELEALRWEKERIEAAIDRADAELDAAEAREAALRQAVEDCEKRCAEHPVIIDGPVAPNPDTDDEPGSRTTTDCPTCQNYADAINRLSDRIGEARDALERAKRRLEFTEQWIETAREEERAAYQAHVDGLMQEAELRAAKRDAEADAVLKAARAELAKAGALTELVAGLKTDRDELRAQVPMLAKALADLEAQMPAAQQALLDCEARCAAAPVITDGPQPEPSQPDKVKIKIGVEQPAPCKPDGDCAIEVSMQTTTDDGEPYSGPMFLTGNRPISGPDGMTCAPARGGGMCVAGDGALVVDIALSKNAKAGDAFCLEAGLPADGGLAVEKAVQLYLAGEGSYRGNIDGIIGPKTQAALSAFATTHGLGADADLPSIYAAMFGGPPAIGEADRQCIVLDIIASPAPKKPAAAGKPETAGGGPKPPKGNNNDGGVTVEFGDPDEDTDDPDAFEFLGGDMPRPGMMMPGEGMMMEPGM